MYGCVLGLNLSDNFNGYLVDIGLCHSIILLVMLKVQGKIFFTFVLTPSNTPQYLHIFVVLLHYLALLILVISDKVKWEIIQSFEEFNHFLSSFFNIIITVRKSCDDRLYILERDDVVFGDWKRLLEKLV